MMTEANEVSKKRIPPGQAQRKRSSAAAAAYDRQSAAPPAIDVKLGPAEFLQNKCLVNERIRLRNPISVGIPARSPRVNKAFDRRGLGGTEMSARCAGCSEARGDERRQWRIKRIGSGPGTWNLRSKAPWYLADRANAVSRQWDELEESPSDIGS